MTITTCPHCQMRIIPRPDGTCPSCNGLVAQTESPAPAPKGSAAVIKRSAKASARKPAAVKAVRTARATPPSPPNAKDIEPVYQDYLQVTKDVRKETVRAFYPYLWTGLIVCVVLVALSFLTWDEVLKDELVKQPGPATGVLIIGGIVLLLGSIVLGAIQAERKANAMAREITKDRFGFSEFYNAFLKRYWPKEGLPAGLVLDKFLKIIGNP